MRGLIVLFALTLGATATGAEARPRLCSLGGGSPPFSIARTQNIVADAHAIVRASAVGYASGRDVAFVVNEVLRGADVPDTLRFMGVLRDEDAVPPELVDDVPHLSYIRRWGGDCMAFTYRGDSEYLLLLRHSEERRGLDPYWSVLAPTNNEIGGADDRWLQWVRAEIARNSPRVERAATVEGAFRLSASVERATVRVDAPTTRRRRCWT